MKRSSTPGYEANIPEQGVMRAGEGAIATSWGRGMIRAGQDF